MYDGVTLILGLIAGGLMLYLISNLNKRVSRLEKQDNTKGDG